MLSISDCGVLLALDDDKLGLVVGVHVRRGGGGLGVVGWGGKEGGLAKRWSGWVLPVGLLCPNSTC